MSACLGVSVCRYCNMLYAWVYMPLCLFVGTYASAIGPYDPHAFLSAYSTYVHTATF